MPRRYICYGVGGVGGTICAKLAQSGLDVVAVARGEHLKVIQESGLRLRTPAEDVTLQVPAVLDPSELQPPLNADDVVIISTKSHQALEVLERLASCSYEPTIICCTNGINTELAALRYFPRVLGMLVQLGGTHLTPGIVICSATGLHGWLDIGLYPEGSDEHCESIAADIRGAQFACEADAQVMMKKRTKLLSNVNNCTAIVGGEGEREARSKLTEMLQAEAEACFQAAGMAYHPRGDAYRNLRVERDDTPRGPELKPGEEPFGGEENMRGGSSTWQSLERGTGDIECDFLNGEISLLGRLHGVPTPVSELMQRLARKAAVEGAGAGGVDASDLMAKL